MEEVLKLKTSPLLLLLRVAMVLMTIVSIVCLFFGLVDVRTEAQKEADRRNALISSLAFKAGVSAVRYAYNDYRFDVDKVNRVSFLNCPQRYVLVVYEDTFGSEQEMTYSYKEKVGYLDNGSLFNQTLSSMGAYDNFGGQSRNYITSFDGEELEILLEETGILWL